MTKSNEITRAITEALVHALSEKTAASRTQAKAKYAELLDLFGNQLSPEQLEACSSEALVMVRTIEVDEAMKKVRVGPNTLKKIPEHLKTHAVCLEAVNHSVDNIEFVPEAMISAEICAALVESDPDSLGKIPAHMRTYDLCMSAFNKSSSSFRHVTTEVKTHEFCLEAVRQDECNIRDVPMHLRSFEVCVAVFNSRHGLNGYDHVLNAIPSKFKEYIAALHTNASLKIGSSKQYISKNVLASSSPKVDIAMQLDVEDLAQLASGNLVFLQSVSGDWHVAFHAEDQTNGAAYALKIKDELTAPLNAFITKLAMSKSIAEAVAEEPVVSSRRRQMSI